MESLESPSKKSIKTSITPQGLFGGYGIVAIPHMGVMNAHFLKQSKSRTQIPVVSEVLQDWSHDLLEMFLDLKSTS